MLLVNILILSQKGEEALKKTGKLLRAQNKVTFVNPHKRNGITAYDNKVSTDSLPTFLDDEIKV